MVLPAFWDSSNPFCIPGMQLGTHLLSELPQLPGFRPIVLGPFSYPHRHLGFHCQQWLPLSQPFFDHRWRDESAIKYWNEIYIFTLQDFVCHQSITETLAILHGLRYNRKHVYNPIYVYCLVFQCFPSSILCDFSPSDGWNWVILDAQ